VEARLAHELRAGLRSRRAPRPPAVGVDRPAWRRSGLVRTGRAVVILLLSVMVPALGAIVAGRALGYGALVVRAGSMGHAYPLGSLTFTRPADAADVEVGDVVLARMSRDSGDMALLHRIVSTDESQGRVVVRTRGDANRSRDPGRYVLPDRVPVATTRIPYLGYLVTLISTPLGWALFVVLPAAALTAGTLVRIWSPRPPVTGVDRSDLA
jgi:signal peptidase I